MAQPVLVVDFGEHTTGVALVVGERAALVRDPISGGGVWPAPASAAALGVCLGSIRAEAQRLCGDEVDRLILTVPTGYGVDDRRRDQLIATGESAGFSEVELLDEAPAAVLAATADMRLPINSLLLVCDLGESWKVSLVQTDGPRIMTLGYESAPYGRELKHAVVAPDRLDRLAEPGLRWVVASARSLIARVGVRGSGLVRAGHAMADVADVAAVVLVGGCAQLGTAEDILRHGLQRPVLRVREPELAVVRGGVRWVTAAASRRLTAEHPRWRVEPLSWTVPGGRARLVRWSVAEGEAFSRGAVMAQVRTPDERVFDLTAPEGGTLLSRRAVAGEVVGPALAVLVKRPASCLAGDQPGFRQQLSAAGEWLLLADRQVLVECAANAEHVRLWSISDGSQLAEFRPTLDDGHPHQGRVFVNPDGCLSLVAWNPSGHFTVWDVRAKRLLTSFRDPHPPATVLVNEGQWRLAAEGGDATSAGRYRRTVATVWDLATGQKVERLSDDWQRRITGYGARSAVDAFGERVMSPDGLLCAVSVRTPDGAAIALQESGSDHEVFRAEQPSRAARAAFTADGRFLLANWKSDQRSQVDVWEL